MVMLFTGCAMADENNAKEDNVQYKVTPVKIKEVFEDGVIDVKTSSGTISQGETNWHSEYIGYYTKKLYINLDWGDTSDSLKLTIYTPDDQILGPYYDSADGRIDGQIYLQIYSSSGISTGTWNYRVYGQSVSGTETYTI